MNRPSKINILGTDVKIRFFDDKERMELDGRFGHWCSNSQSIAICESLESTVMADTFLHEVLHAIAWFLCFKRQIENYKNVVDLEEVLVSQISTSLQSTIRSNVDVFAWYASLLHGGEQYQEKILDSLFDKYYGSKQK